MPISVDWATKIIHVPQSYLTPLGGGVYEMDVETFRTDLRALEASEEGIVYDDAHVHITSTVLSGAPYARFVIITNGYTVEFEDGQYAVNLIGANHNIGDVAVVNQVSLRTFNSAGYVSDRTGAGTMR